MKNIVVIGSFSFSDEQINILKGLGAVTFVNGVGSASEWLSKVQGADVICSDGSFLLENLPKLKNVFVTYPYIELGLFDSEALAKNGVFVSNTQGSNRDSIVEWVVFALLSLFRKFPNYLNATANVDFQLTESLQGKTALVVGKGNTGSKIGELCQTLGMQVDYFKRGDDLYAKSLNKNVVINCLNCNSTSQNLLNQKFFMSLTKGTYFVSYVRPFTYDEDGLIKAINADIVAGAAIDCDPQIPGDTGNDFYQKFLKTKNALVTPHVAFATKQAKANGAATVIANIQAYINGNPQNILNKN